MNKPTHKAHPAAELFPLMDKAELKELAADIKKNGLIAGIVRDKDGVILDGRNRLAACRVAGVEPRRSPDLRQVLISLCAASKSPLRSPWRSRM